MTSPAGQRLELATIRCGRWEKLQSEGRVVGSVGSAERAVWARQAGKTSGSLAVLSMMGPSVQDDGAMAIPDPRSYGVRTHSVLRLAHRGPARSPEGGAR